MSREAIIQAKTMAVLNQRDSPCRVWRNNVGGYYDANGRYIEYGLAKGSADLIGLERIVITPAMVGLTIARFLSVEMKTPRGRLTPEQEAWARTIDSLGGTSKVFRDPSEAIEHIRRIKEAA